jgi:hypothetical protein
LVNAAQRDRNREAIRRFLISPEANRLGAA